MIHSKLNVIRNLLAIGWWCVVPAVAWEPLQVHPQNPYIFKFRGEATVLRTFAEHYGSVINPDFDFIPYLDVLERDGQNLTRILLLGFRFHEGQGIEPLSPTAAAFLQPWARVTSQGNALDGQGKWDFSIWNEVFFTRLRNFAQACSDRGIVIEMSLFNTIYGNSPEFWENSPFHPANNVQGYGPASRFDAVRATDANLLAAQVAAVRRIVRELNPFDNIYYEIQNEPMWNEPGSGEAAETTFHNTMLGAIRDEESTLPKQHMVAHNFPDQLGSLSSDFDIINCHYPFDVQGTPVLGGEGLLQNEYSRQRVLAMDESSASSALGVRVEAWMFILGGGGVYNCLDAPNLVYTLQNEAGDVEPAISIRRTLRDIGTYTDNLHLPAMRRDLAWITGGIPPGARLQAMASPGQQYVAYLHHGVVPAGDYFTVYSPIHTSNHSTGLQVSLPAGTWRAVWTRPEDLATLHTETFTHAGGTRTLQTVIYQADAALRIDRTGSADTTPPPVPKSLLAGIPANGQVTLSWNPVTAADIAFHQIYHSTAPGVQPVVANRIAVLSSGQSTFTHDPVAMNSPHHYVVTSVDLNGNESAASREILTRAAGQPFAGAPWNMPGTIQCEHFDIGGPGIAYHDLTPGNTGDPFRTSEQVDIAASNDPGGGHHVHDTNAGEWLEYTLRISKTDTFHLDLRCSSSGSGAEIQILIDGADAGGNITIPAGPWQTLRVGNLALSEGIHVLRLVMAGNSTTGDAGQFNWFSLTPRSRTGPNAHAGIDRVIVDTDWNLSENVTLSAAACVAGASPIVSHSWRENGAVIATGINPTPALATGTHRIELLTTDSAGLTDSDEVWITIDSPGFVNGGFESGLAGWSSSGNASRSGSPAGTEGSYLVVFGDANTASNGSISQSFPTVPGQVYRLRFDMGVFAANASQQRLQLDVTGGETLLTRTYSAIGAGGGSVVWSTKNETFTADSNSTTLRFQDISTTSISIDLLLDHVRLTRVLDNGILPEIPTFERLQTSNRIWINSPDIGTYRLQRSDDLSVWSTIGQRMVTTPGVIEFTDTTAPETPVFYRIGLDQP